MVHRSIRQCGYPLWDRGWPALAAFGAAPWLAALLGHGRGAHTKVKGHGELCAVCCFHYCVVEERDTVNICKYTYSAYSCNINPYNINIHMSSIYMIRDENIII